MEATVKFNIIDAQESDWTLGAYANGKIRNLRNEDLINLISDIAREAIVDNGVYHDLDDIEMAVKDVLPAISIIILNPEFSHIKNDYDMLVEMVTYLTIRLA
ncbi:MAG: hypothetical protein SNG27_01080 [Rikenellaceae bacterium]